MFFCVIFAGMKHLLWIIVAMMVLGAVVPGCDDVPRYDGRLTAADSLIHDHADSALTMLEALTPTDLATEGDRAYHDLLLTQARYKCYRPATSDSAINRALAYYRAHPNEQEKLTRAYIYKGAVMEELDHPDSAMFYYKTAKETAASDDYFNLGYCNLRIAQLYQSFYSNDSAVLVRMRNATRYFQEIQDTSFLITTLGTQGAYPNITGEDSAIKYLNWAIDLAKKINSPKGLQYQSKLSGIYFYRNDFDRAKELAMEIVRNNPDKSNESQFYFYAVMSYLHLGDVDSARWLMSLVPNPVNAVDSMNYFGTLAKLELGQKHYLEYKKYSEIANNVNINILTGSNNSTLSVAELAWDAQQQIKETEVRKDNNWMLFILCLVVLFIILLTIYGIIIRKRIRSYRELLDGAKFELESLLKDYDEDRHEWENERKLYRQEIELKSNKLIEIYEERIQLEQKQLNVNRQVSSIVRLRNNALNELYENIKIKTINENGGKSIKSFLRLFKEMHEQKGILSKTLPRSFWDKLKISVDGEFEGIASFIEREYSDLSENDMHLFLLSCANIPNPIIKICMKYRSDVTVSKNKKRLMKDKIKLDVKIDEFIQMYLRGDIGN